MQEFEYPLSILEINLPVFSSGALFIGILLFTYLYIRSRREIHLSMALMAFSGFAFSFSQTFLINIGSYLGNAEFAMQFHRTEQLGVACFLFSLPLWLGNVLTINKGWKKFNRILTYVGIALFALVLIIAFVAPELYVNLSVPDREWLSRQSSHGRASTGMVYALRDLLLGILMLYTLVLFILEMIRKHQLRYLLIPFIGIIFAISGAMNDILKVYIGFHLPIFPPGEYSRFAFGITTMIILSMAAQIQEFIDITKRVAMAEGRIREESERNKKQNIFIKEVLKESSSSISNEATTILDTVSKFRANTQNQAAATEEVTATIEEITGGIDQTTIGAELQNKNVQELSATMKALSKRMDTLGNSISETVELISNVSDSAKTGEQSLTVMNKSMSKIRSSSSEIVGIVAIINDISDQINLLALNASIEAARAGEQGRGFAVVADEVSKLAEQTAASIQNINSLISTNEKEINNGIENVSNAMETFNSIIETISQVIEKTGEIPEQISEQMMSNLSASQSANEVKQHSEQISNTMNEHKNAITEIMVTISTINELAQENSFGIQNIEDSFRRLNEQLSHMNKDIEEYKE